MHKYRAMRTVFTVLAITLALAAPTLAVVNSGTDAERREATISLDTTYGPPPTATIAELQLPAPVYGVPATHTYPAPPPDIVPQPQAQIQIQVQVPHKEYGIPVQQYGPPAVHVEYGPPPSGAGEHHSSSNEASFFDQVKQHFGTPKAHYGAPSQQHPHAVYGPPPQRPQAPRPPKNNYGPPAQHLVYGPPKPKAPKPIYGAPSKQQQHYAHPAPVYGPPPTFKQPRPSKPIHTYGPPPPPTPVYGPPAPQHRPPPPPPQQPDQQYGPPPALLQQQLPQQRIPVFSTLPTSVVHQDHHASAGSAVSVIAGGAHAEALTAAAPHRCEGWRPIAGPAIPYSNSEEQIHLQQQSSADSSFVTSGYSVAGELDARQHQQQLPQQLTQQQPQPEYTASAVASAVVSNVGVASADVGLQLPVNNAINFYYDTASKHHGSHSGGNNEVHASPIHITYGVPAAYRQQYQSSGHHGQQQQHQFTQQRRPSIGLIPPSGQYGVPPGGSYSGIAIQQQQQHGSNNLAPHPQLTLPPPTRPIQFRPPVPQGLIESIGHTVQQQDAHQHIGYHSANQQQQQYQQQYQQQSIYISPPASEIPPPPQGLESLPLDQGVAQLFHPHLDQPQALPYNAADTASSGQQQVSISLGGHDCGHGPAYVQQDGASFQVSSGYEAAKSSALETQSQTIAEFTQSGYEQSGGETLLNVIQVNDEHSPTSSYGPPPSGIPDDHHHGEQTQQIITTLIAQNDNAHAQAEALQSTAATGSEQNVQIVTAISATESQERGAQQQQQQQQLQYDQQLQQVSVESQQQQLIEETFHSDGQEQQQLQHYTLEHHQQLPGLDGTGLDIVSAQKSHSLTIPVHGSHGTYQLQFQSAGDSNALDTPNHQQILSDGLLQQILSAIEQPDESKIIAEPQVSSSYEEVDARSDVDQFIKSQIGQEALSEPKIQ